MILRVHPISSIAGCRVVVDRTGFVALAGGVDVTSNAPVLHKKDLIDKLRDRQGLAQEIS